MASEQSFTKRQIREMAIRLGLRPRETDLKSYADSGDSALLPLDGSRAMNANLDMADFRISNLLGGGVGHQAVNRNQLDQKSNTTHSHSPDFVGSATSIAAGTVNSWTHNLGTTNLQIEVQGQDGNGVWYEGEYFDCHGFLDTSNSVTVVNNHANAHVVRVFLKRL